MRSITLAVDIAVAGLVAIAAPLAPAAVHAAVHAAAQDAQAGQISGRVIEDPTGQPIAGAIVRLIALGRQSPSIIPAPPPQTPTGANGEFTFDGLPPGRYQIDARKAGFASELPPLNPGALRPMDLAAGQTLDNVSIVLQKGGVITGQILDPVAGEPLAEANVMAMRRPPGTVASTARANGAPGPRFLPTGQGAQTNDLGEFRIYGLPPGDYVIAATLVSAPLFGVLTPDDSANTTASRPSAKPVQTFYPGTADVNDAQRLTVLAGQVVGGITFRLVTAATYQVSGVVVDEADAPVANSMVMLMGDPRGPTGPLLGAPSGARTNALGQFVIQEVASGSYIARATIPLTITQGAGIGAFSTTSTTFIGGGSSSPNQANVTVSGANVEGVKIVVRRPQ